MGLSAINHNKKIAGDGAGSYLWMAPEALLFEPHNEKADLYSFAIVVWQMVVWEADPYKKYLELGDLDALVKAVCHRKERPKIPKGVHPSIVEIMETNWQSDPVKRQAFSIILSAIDDCIFKTSFYDEGAVKFWKRHFGGEVKVGQVAKNTKLAVPYNKFAEALYVKLALRLPQKPEENPKYLCLKAMSCDPLFKQPTVTIERFSLVTKWFGPLLGHDNKTIIEEIYDIMICSWFHGDISKEEAVFLLSGDGNTKKHKGTFLVRLSISEPVYQNPFTITKLNAKHEAVHQRIYFKDGRYSIPIKDKNGESEISSIKGLKHLIEEIMKAKYVTHVASRTRYSHIFQASTKPTDLGYIN